MSELYFLGDIAEITTLSGTAATLWTAVLALGIGMVGYRIGKRILGRF